MPKQPWLRLIEVRLTVALAAIGLAAGRADRRDRAKLADDLAVAKQALAQADARQHERDAQLAQTLAALAVEKHSVTTSAQIIRALPQQIPLPVPITLEAPSPTSQPKKPDCSSGSPRSPTGLPCGPEGLEPTQPRANPANNAAAPPAILPADDLKPLYDFSLDCTSR